MRILDDHLLPAVAPRKHEATSEALWQLRTVLEKSEGLASSELKQALREMCRAADFDRLSVPEVLRRITQTLDSIEALSALTPREEREFRATVTRYVLSTLARAD